jgi:hypothetical protein
MLIVDATRSRRFRARAVRVDSTVIDADVKYPTDAGLAAHGVSALAPITDRIVSLSDPDARPIRKGKLGQPNLCRYRGYAESDLVRVGAP